LGKFNFLLNTGVASALLRARPDVLLCGGYNYVACWQASAWARRRRIPVLLWSESTIHDQRRRRALVEFLKRRFRTRCTAYIAAGQSSREYLVHLGAREDRIFTAPDAVDVDHYATSAERARSQAEEIRARYGLPRHYILFVGRLVKEKGVFDLLSAYSALDGKDRSQVGLVFAGDGCARSLLMEQAKVINPGCVRFCGFVHREQLPGLYALAEALVFPTHSDTWGMVVNEAMSCGLPIVASSVAGCLPDLVADGDNGFIVPPNDIQSLTSAMARVIQNRELAIQMGNRSACRIRDFTPESCAQGLAAAANVVCQEIA
jgi:glycosyltransferase involved in cell wall biosynthesis